MARGLSLAFAGAAVALFGLFLGAASQREVFLGSEEADLTGAAGSVVLATAGIVAAGVALLAFALRRPTLAPARVARLVALAGGATWLLVVLVQADFPNYNAVEEARVATLIQSTILVDERGAVSAHLPLLVLGAAALTGLYVGVRRLAAGRSERSLGDLRREHLGLAAFLVPVYALAAIGSLQVLLGLPPDTPAAFAAILLPLGMVGPLVLAGTLTARAWILVGLHHQPDAAPVARENWRILERIDFVAAALVAAVALSSTVLPQTATPETSLGRTLVWTLRSHGQAHIVVAIVWLAAFDLHRRIAERLQRPRPGRGVADAAWIHAAIGVGVVGAIAAAFTGSGLLPWAVAWAPVAVVAAVRLPARCAFMVQMMAAWTMWGVGNSLLGVYDGFEFPALEFTKNAGALALWRVGGAGLAAWAIARAIAAGAPSTRRVVAVPLTVTLGVCLAAVALLELPLAAWMQPATPVDKVAVGSLVRSQAAAVQIMMHALAAACGLVATLAAARLLRPLWFRRRARPVPSPAPSVTA